MSKTQVDDINRNIYDIKNKDDYEFKMKKGLNREIVEEISAKKNDPDWMREIRLKALETYEKLELPTWGPDLSELKMDEIATYVKPKSKLNSSWDDVPEDIKKTFAKVSLFCEPNGLFLFDINTPYKHRNVLGNNTFVYDIEEVYCVWQNYYEEENNRVTMSLDFFEPDENGKYSRYSDEFSEIAFDSNVIEQALEEVGFKIVGKYDYDSYDAPNESSEKVVYAAQKIK